MPRGKKATQQAQANPNPQPNPNPNPQPNPNPNPNPNPQVNPNPNPQPQAPVNNNTNTNSNGGNNMNGQANNNNNNNNNTQTTVNGGNTMDTMMQMMMMQMMQNMQNQNQNPTNQLMQLLVTKELQNINNSNEAPKSAMGQTIADMKAFKSLLSPSEEALTRAEDTAEAKAREKFNTAYAAYQTALPNLSDTEIRALLKVANVEEPTTTQIELERKKAREEAIAKQAEDFNTSVKAYQSFAATINPNAPVPSPTPAAPVPSPASPKRNFGEAFCDVLASPSYGRIAVINAWKGVK